MIGRGHCELCGIPILQGRLDYGCAQKVQNHPPTNECPDYECVICGVRDCPQGESLHYHHHDGCPVCDGPNRVEEGTP